MSPIKRVCITAATSVALLAVSSGVATVPFSPGASMASPSSAVAASLPDSGRVALSWAPTYMSNNHSYSRAEAVSLAKKVDLVGAMPYAFRRHTGAMRSANSDIRLIAYANGTLSGHNKVRHLGESAFAHDSRGRRITSNVWGTTLMNPASRAWRDGAAAQCRDRVRTGGYDGCAFDTVSLGIFSGAGRFTGFPVNPSTGRPYTERDYRSTLSDFMRALGHRLPNYIRVGNSVETDYRYWRDTISSRSLALSQPAVMMEDFLRAASWPIGRYPDEAKWLRNVRIVQDLEANKVTGLYVTKTWDGTASRAKKAAWQRYSMASFLLAANGNSYYSFTPERSKPGSSGASAPHSMPSNIGDARGAMVRQSSGVYSRKFDRGMSLVNPTNSGRTVKLPSSMKNLQGRWVTSIWLPARSGNVLTSR